MYKKQDQVGEGDVRPCSSNCYRMKIQVQQSLDYLDGCGLLFNISCQF